MNKLGRTLFIVNSPFQCLCMLEAISYFNIKDFDVLETTDYENNSEKIERLLKPLNICLNKIRFEHIINDLYKHLFRPYKFYDTIFLGNYNSYDEVLAWIYGRFGARIYYLDDGVQAINIFSKNYSRSYKNCKIKMIMSFYKIFGILKGMSNNLTFFTIFDVSSDKIKIIRNPFSRLHINRDVTKKGVYIIGTNSSILPMINHSYEEYLYHLIVTLKKRFLDDIIYYCPHRRDKNNSKIINFCREKGVVIYNTQISVEIDFVTNNIYPIYIVGFGSNALITLKKIFPSSLVENIVVELDSELLQKEYKQTTIYFEKNGVRAVNIFE